MRDFDYLAHIVSSNHVMAEALDIKVNGGTPPYPFMGTRATVSTKLVIAETLDITVAHEIKMQGMGRAATHHAADDLHA